MMKTAWKGYPGNSWGYDTWGRGYFSQYDIFTIGAGYLDIYAALKNNDVVNGGAPSPVVNFNATTGKASSEQQPVHYLGQQHHLGQLHHLGRTQSSGAETPC